MARSAGNPLTAKPRRGCGDGAQMRLLGSAGGQGGYPVLWMTIGTSILLIAVGAILRYAVNASSNVINIQTVGLILMIAGGAGLALSLLYELVQQGGPPKDRDESPQRRSGYDDPTRRL
jgi:hypothetical protein